MPNTTKMSRRTWDAGSKMYWKNQWNGEQKTVTLLEVVLPMVSWTVKFFASTTYCSLRRQTNLRSWLLSSLKITFLVERRNDRKYVVKRFSNLWRSEEDKVITSLECPLIIINKKHFPYKSSGTVYYSFTKWISAQSRSQGHLLAPPPYGLVDEIKKSLGTRLDLTIYSLIKSILQCDHSNKSYWAVLACGTVYGYLLCCIRGLILFSLQYQRNRGTQRQYSSKPLKRSIIKCILVFKR